MWKSKLTFLYAFDKSGLKNFSSSFGYLLRFKFSSFRDPSNWLKMLQLVDILGQLGCFFSFAHPSINQTRMQKKWGNVTEDAVAI